jgi:two-component system cell cycle response regulator DivK
MAKSPHALIIDDQASNLEVLSRLLAAQNISSTQVQDLGELREDIHSSSPIDLVFLDLEMPQMDGYQVFNLLRGELGTTTPIIACTVHANEVSTARELGFTGFLAKPLDQKRFPEQVRSILRGEQVWDF